MSAATIERYHDHPIASAARGRVFRAQQKCAFTPAKAFLSMFVDMRGSTQMAADKLPFDTVFIVNRFLGAISQAVIEPGAT